MAHDKASFSPLLVGLFGVFITCLLLSNIVAGKIIQIFGIIIDAATIMFPLTYILGDVFTEVYGYSRTRRIIWIGFAANLFMALLCMLVVALPYPAFFQNQNAYAIVLGAAPRLVAASLVAYWCGEFANSVVLSLLKKATQGRHLWMRTIGSTIVGEGLDTIIFVSIAFTGTMPAPALFHMMLAQYVFKVLFEVALTPVTYRVIAAIKRRENLDSYDRGVAYNPFRL